VAIGALAGHHRGRQFRPTRLTPSHAWAREQNATFVESAVVACAIFSAHR